MANPNSSAQRSFAAEPYDSVAAVLASKQITAALIGQRIHIKGGLAIDIVASGLGAYNHPISGVGMVPTVLSSGAFPSAEAFKNFINSTTPTEPIIAEDNPTFSQGLNVMGRLSGDFKVAGTVGASVSNGGRIEDSYIASAGAPVVGVYFTGQGRLRGVTVDMSDSTASGGRHAIATVGTGPIGHVDMHDVTAIAPNGFAILPNETAPPQKLTLTHFSASAQADALEFNYPDDPGRQHVVWGGHADITAGGSGTGSGFAVGVAHLQGFVIGGFVSKTSRTAGIHIEDGCADGVVTGFSLNGCLKYGIWYSSYGYGNNEAEARPTPITSFTAEYTGPAGADAAGIYSTWAEGPGNAPFQLYSDAVLTGFPIGIKAEGQTEQISDNIVIRGSDVAIRLAGRVRHYGTLYAADVDNLALATQTSRVSVEAIIAPKVKPMSETVFSFTGAQDSPRAIIRRFAIAAVDQGISLPVGEATQVRLIRTPRRASGKVMVWARSAYLESRNELVSVADIHFDGTTLTVTNILRDYDANTVPTSTGPISVSDGYLRLSVTNVNSSGTWTLPEAEFSFDGVWVE